MALGYSVPLTLYHTTLTVFAGWIAYHPNHDYHIRVYIPYPMQAVFVSFIPDNLGSGKKVLIVVFRGCWSFGEYETKESYSVSSRLSQETNDPSFSNVGPVSCRQREESVSFQFAK